MFNRVMLFAMLSMLILCLAGCGGDDDTKQAAQPAAAPAPKPVEEKAPVYELTKDEVTKHEGWTSKNISVLGAKIGDKTREVEKDLGKMENTRTLKDEQNNNEYLTIYQGQGVFVYTTALTGKLRMLEINQNFEKKIADPKLQKLLTGGDLKYMHEVLGMEEGEPVQNADEMSTEYRYDSRGIRFVKFKVGGKTINAIRFIEIKK
jgi:hypothetical protein